MNVYASTADLSAVPWNVTPANGATLLRMASNLVASATMGDLYGTDLDGYPSDTGLRQAMRDATCAQASFWAAAGIDPAAGGVGITAPAKVSESKSMGGRSHSVSYADLSTSVTVQQSRGEATRALCGESLSILRQAGLGNTAPVSV